MAGRVSTPPVVNIVDTTLTAADAAAIETTVAATLAGLVLFERRDVG